MASTSKTKKSFPFDSDQTPGSSVYSSKHNKKDLTVRDEQGRQRFHGAFTGGFSAGYFNTVGSVEGFEPKKFISRKNDPDLSPKDTNGETHGSNRRRPKFTHKPEDYMDDEDFSEFGIAPKCVTVNEELDKGQMFEFAGPRGFQLNNKSEKKVPNSLIRPVQFVAEKLLQKMKYHSHGRRIDLANIFSSSITLRDSGTDIVEEVSYKVKNDRYGLGYKPLISQAVDSMISTRAAPLQAVLQSGQRIKISGEAFGVGALDDDEDYATFDTNIYGEDEIGNYDFGNNDPVRKKKAKEKIKKYDGVAKPGMNDVIEGFVRSRNNPYLEINAKLLAKYPPPLIPPDWKPPSIKSKSKHSALCEDLLDDDSNKTNNRPTVSHPPHDDNDRSDPPEEREASSNKTNPAQVEELFKRPLSGILASKFVVSSEKKGLLGQGLKAGLTQYSELNINEMETKDSNKLDDLNESPKPPVKIVRKTFQWHPSNILCKRFNVPNPFPDSNIIGIVDPSKPSQPPVSGMFSRSAASKDDKSKPLVSDIDDVAVASQDITEFEPIMPMDILESIFDLPQDETDDLIHDVSIYDEDAKFTLNRCSPPMCSAKDNKGEEHKFVSRHRDVHCDKPQTHIEDVEIIEVATRSQPVIVSISSSSSGEDSSDEYGPQLPPTLRARSTTISSESTTRKIRCESDSTFSESECDRSTGDRKRSKKKDKRKKKRKSRKHKKHKR